MANINDTYASVLSGYSGSVNDRRSELLTGILAYAKPLSLNDMEAAALASLGYTGALNDAWDKYIKALGGFGISAKADYLSSTFYGNPVPFLFASSQPGVWYDPSDLTTMFQDNLGATPVTAPGQTVGRISDKSGRGNHATQATLAQRPIYGINPVVGTRNLLTYSSWSDAVGGSPGTAPTGWTIGFGTGAQTSLVGSLDVNGAQAIQFDADSGERIFYTQTVNVVAGSTYILSTEILAVSGLGNTVVAIVSGTATGTAVNVVNPTSTGRVTATYVCTVSGSVTLRFGLGVTSAAGTSSITFKKPQFEVGSKVTNYQKVVSQYEVTEAGVNSVGYLLFDGVDDNMVIPSLSLTGAESLFFCFGAQRLSTTSRTTLMTFGKGGNSTPTYPGFALEIRGSSAPTYAPILLTASATASGSLLGSSSNTFGDAATRVLSATRTALRVNANALATTGSPTNFDGWVTQNNRLGCNYNFANNQFWKGGIYSAIFLAGAVTAGQITSTEKWVNSKTGAF